MSFIPNFKKEIIFENIKKIGVLDKEFLSKISADGKTELHGAKSIDPFIYSLT